MSSGVEVPENIPVLDLSDEQLDAIAAFYNEFAGASLSTASRALVTGYAAGVRLPTCTEAHISGSMHPKTLTLYGQDIPFEDAYKTSTKHTYYSGVHAGGFRITIDYHDAAGGSYACLKVNKEVDV